MIKNKKILLLSACVFALTPFEMFAQDKSDKTVADIRDGVSAYIGSVVKSDSESVIKLNGSVGVEFKKEFYYVTLPEFLFDEYYGAGTLNTGIIAANITPRSDGEWRVSAALPESMVWTSADGSVNGIISFGKQKITGLWSPHIGSFKDFDASVKDIRLVDAERKIDIRAASASKNVTVIPKGQRSSTVTGLSSVEKISGNFLDGKGKFDVGAATFGFKYGGVSLEKYVEAMKKAVARGKITSSLNDMWLGTAVMQGSDELVVSDVSVVNDNNLETSVSRIKAGNSISKTEDGKSGFDFSFEAGRINILKDKSLSAVNPADDIKKISFSASVNNIDMSVVRNLMSETSGALPAETVSGNSVIETGVEHSGLSADDFDFETIISIFTDSGASFTLKDFLFEFGNDAFIGLSGILTADAAAVRKYVGKAEIVIKNPDKASEGIISAIERFSAANKHSGQIAEQVKFVTVMLRSFGNTENDTKGVPVTRISLELTRDGRFLLNGREAVPNFGISGMSGETVPEAMPSAVVPAPSAPGAVVEMPAAE